MKFSVIVPVYNVADYLENCIDSIINQDYEDYELILIDDGSTDGKSNVLCDEIKRKYNKVTVIHQENKGLGEARNSGIRIAQGEFLVFVDSDDSINEGMLSTISNYIDRYNTDIINFGYNICSEGKDKVKCLDNIKSDVVFNIKNCPEFMESSPTAWTRVWRKKLFTENNIYYPSRVWYEDIRTTEKLFAVSESIVSINECFYNYYVRDNSITHNTNIERNIEIIYAFEDIISWFKEKGLFNEYYDEISRLAVEHILIAGSVRVLRVDYKSELLNKFYDFMKTNFSDFNYNPRLVTLSKNQKLIYNLICHKKYRAVRNIFLLKDALN